MIFHERLRNTRIDKDIGQKEIAAALGMAQQQYSRYETGKRSLPIDYLPEICRYLGVSADYLLGLEDKREHKKRTP